MNTKTHVTMLAETRTAEEIVAAIDKLADMTPNAEYSYLTIQNAKKVLFKARRQAERSELIEGLFE